MSPFNAFIFLQGLKSLPLRMERHCQNAQAIANFLGQRESITKVHYPSFSEAEERRRPETYMGGKYCGALVGFKLTGGREARRKFIDALNMVYPVANIGDSRTLAILPSTTTHSQLTAEEQEASGINENYVRLSFGMNILTTSLPTLTKRLM